MALRAMQRFVEGGSVKRVLRALSAVPAAPDRYWDAHTFRQGLDSVFIKIPQDVEEELKPIVQSIAHEVDNVDEAVVGAFCLPLCPYDPVHRNTPIYRRHWSTCLRLAHCWRR